MTANVCDLESLENSVKDVIRRIQQLEHTVSSHHPIYSIEPENTSTCSKLLDRLELINQRIQSVDSSLQDLSSLRLSTDATKTKNLKHATNLIDIIKRHNLGGDMRLELLQLMKINSPTDISVADDVEFPCILGSSTAPPSRDSTSQYNNVTIPHRSASSVTEITDVSRQGFQAFTESEFNSIPNHLRAWATLDELNDLYKGIWDIVNKKKSNPNQTSELMTIKALAQENLQVVGKKGAAKLQMLRQLEAIIVTKDNKVKLVKPRKTRNKIK